MTAPADHPVLEPLRRVYRAVRGVVARALHPGRRRRARRRIAEARPERVVFVCTGNICRSPYAERAARARLGARGASFASAGLLGPGRPSPPEAREAARRRGISLDGHTSRLLEPEEPSRADLLVVMQRSHDVALRRRFGAPPERIVFLGDLDPEPPSRRAILDPFGRPLDVFVEVYTRIDRCLEQLGRTLRPEAGDLPEGAPREDP